LIPILAPAAVALPIRDVDTFALVANTCI
jgi:hypothetical protein